MYDLIIGLGESLIKHGVSLSFVGAALFVLLKQRPSKRWLRKHFPRFFRDDGDIMNYELRQIRIESKVDMLLEERGLKWDADYLNGKNAPTVTTGQTMKSLSPQAVSARADIAAYFTRLKATYLSQQRRMKMKSKLLSRKFLMALATGILIVLNDGLDLGLDKDTILSVIAIIGGWIFVEGGADIVKMKKEANYDYSGIETERKAAEDSSAA